MQIDRKSRNRRGGHKCSPALQDNHLFEGANHYTPVERKLIKRLSKKKMRRQWQSTQAEVNKAVSNDWAWEDEQRELEVAELIEAYGDWFDADEEEQAQEEYLYFYDPDGSEDFIEPVHNCNCIYCTR